MRRLMRRALGVSAFINSIIVYIHPGRYNVYAMYCGVFLGGYLQGNDVICVSDVVDVSPVGWLDRYL